jgi:hypothetical protein
LGRGAINGPFFGHFARSLFASCLEREKEMKPDKKRARLARRQRACVQTNHDEGPNKRWRTGGYRMPGSKKR